MLSVVSLPIAFGSVVGPHKEEAAGAHSCSWQSERDTES